MKTLKIYVTIFLEPDLYMPFSSHARKNQLDTSYEAFNDTTRTVIIILNHQEPWNIC